MKTIQRFFLAILTFITSWLNGSSNKKNVAEGLWRWRDDRTSPSHERPTVHSVVICAEDIVHERRSLRLVIRHVRTLEGRGFMASVEDTRGGGISNGTVFLIEDDSARNKAVIEGLTILTERLDEINVQGMRSPMGINNGGSRRPYSYLN